MEAQTSFDMAEYNDEGDAMMESVMPDSWHGHARREIRASDLSERQAQFATELSRRLLLKGATHCAETAAKASIKKARQKF